MKKLLKKVIHYNIKKWRRARSRATLHQPARSSAGGWISYGRSRARERNVDPYLILAASWLWLICQIWAGWSDLQGTLEDRIANWQINQKLIKKLILSFWLSCENKYMSWKINTVLICPETKTRKPYYIIFTEFHG